MLRCKQIHIAALLAFATLLRSVSAGPSKRLREAEQFKLAFAVPRFTTPILQGRDVGPCLPPEDGEPTTFDFSGKGLANFSDTSGIKASSFTLYGEKCGGRGGGEHFRLPVKASNMDDAGRFFSVAVPQVLEGEQGLASQQVGWIFAEGGPLRKGSAKAGRVPPVWCGKERALRRFILLRPEATVGGSATPDSELEKDGLYFLVDMLDGKGTPYVCGFGENAAAVRKREKAAAAQKAAETSSDREGDEAEGDVEADVTSDSGGGLSGGVVAGIVAAALGLTILVGIAVGLYVAKARRTGNARGRGYQGRKRRSPVPPRGTVFGTGEDSGLGESQVTASGDGLRVAPGPVREFQPVVLVSEDDTSAAD